MRTTDVETLAAALADAARPVVLTGAGLGVASGIPTYRGQHDSLWGRYSVSWATSERFDEDPSVWWRDFGFKQRDMFRGRIPNDGHTALAHLALKLPALRVVSQNVDGLERAAGLEPERLVEVHGTINQLFCVDDTCAGWRGFDESAAPVRVGTPRCPSCFAVARPLVMFFDETYGAHPAFRAFAARTWLAEADLLLLIGTSDSLSLTNSAVASAAGRRVPVFSINPVAHELAWTIMANAEHALPALCGMLGCAHPQSSS